MLMSGRSYEKDSGTKRPEQTWHQELAGSWTLNVAFFFGGQAFSNRYMAESMLILGMVSFLAWVSSLKYIFLVFNGPKMLVSMTEEMSRLGG